MRIMGIDPGLQITGYGIVDSTGDGIKLVEAGCIRTNAKQKMEMRLKTIFDELSDAISEFQPDVVCVENLYSHFSHPKTAIIMAHARGIMYLAAQQKNIDLVEYSATQIKQSLTGYGRASKLQIQRMVQKALRLAVPPNPVDVTDALAVALCHTNVISHKMGRLQ